MALCPHTSIHFGTYYIKHSTHSNVVINIREDNGCENCTQNQSSGVLYKNKLNRNLIQCLDRDEYLQPGKLIYPISCTEIVFPGHNP